MRRLGVLERERLLLGVVVLQVEEANWQDDDGYASSGGVSHLAAPVLLEIDAFQQRN